MKAPVFYTNIRPAEGQAQGWLSEFNVSPEKLRLALEYEWSELEHNGGRARVKKNTVSNLYGVLKNTNGVGRRPVDFKTMEEIELETYMDDEHRRKEAKEKLTRLKFNAITENPNSDQYQALWRQVPAGMTSGPYASPLEAIEAEMWAIFSGVKG